MRNNAKSNTRGRALPCLPLKREPLQTVYQFLGLTRYPDHCTDLLLPVLAMLQAVYSTPPDVAAIGPVDIKVRKHATPVICHQETS
jgi:hypothetical protein